MWQVAHRINQKKFHGIISELAVQNAGMTQIETNTDAIMITVLLSFNLVMLQKRNASQ